MTVTRWFRIKGRKKWPESSMEGGWVGGKEDTNSLPGPGEMTTTRNRCRIHNVPLRTRFLLEELREHLKKRMRIEGLSSMTCCESGQHRGTISGSGRR